MSERQSDLRYQKSEQRLLQSLDQLLQQGKMIKVCDLCRQAGVFESTFYRHYRNIQDLINQKEQQLMQRFDRVLARARRHHEDLAQLVKDTLIFIYQNRTDLRLLSHIDHDKIPLAIMSKLRPLTTTHWQPYAPQKLALIYSIYSHEVAAVLTTWGEEEDFATTRLARHKHDIIYLTETAIKRLKYLVAD